jgi:predicted glycosyltransferase
MRALLRGRGIARSLGGELPGDVLGIPAARLLSDRIAVLGFRISDAVLAIETSRRAIEVLRPQCLYVVDAYDLWAQALVVAARDADVRSVEVQHGIIGHNHSGYLHLDGEVAPDRSQRSPYSPIADMIVVHGQGAKEELIDLGRFPPDAIKITGSPNIQAARRRLEDRTEIRSRLGLAKEAFVVLYFGAPHHVFPEDVDHLRTFLACCRSMPEIRAVLRPHPADQGPRAYRAAALAAGVDAPVMTQQDPLELILAADVVISYNSTTALDAMALERPVIHINMSGSPNVFRFVEEGGALSATTAEELRAALLSLGSPEGRQRLVRRHVLYVRHYYAPCPDPAGAMLEVGFPSRTER